MPIKTKSRGGLALSDIRRLPRLGHIRLGIKKISQRTNKEYPSEVDYFILDPKTPDEQRNQELIDEFKRFYGNQPKSIRIMFPPADPEIFFPQYYKRYGQTTLLKCKGDGEEAICSLEEFAEGLEILGKTERGLTRVRCLGPECPHQQGEKPSCNRVASLQVLLPELIGNGVWQINTSSWNSIVNMNSAIAWLKMCCGRYYGIPFNLMRVPTEIQYEGKKSVHYILSYDQNESLAQIQKVALVPMERVALPAPDETKDEYLFPNQKKEEEPPEEPPAAKVDSHRVPPKDPGESGGQKDLEEATAETMRETQESGEKKFSLPQQRDQILKLWKKKGKSNEDLLFYIENNYSGAKSLAELTFDQANDLLVKLQRSKPR